jgi:hypothetical protein
MPVLKPTEGASTETDLEKVNLLRTVFFPQPPEVDLSDIHTSQERQGYTNRR